MIQEVEKNCDEIERLSKSLGIEVVTSKNKVELKEYIQELNEDLKTLKSNISKIHSKGISEKELLSFLIANLNTSLVDLLSDIENIYEILVMVAKNYSPHLEN